MGYNRSGTRRKARLKRARREQERLAAKAAAAQPPPSGGGLVAKVKDAAEAVAHAVGEAAHKVADAVRGKHGD
jgi:hypothetical protein